VGCSGNPWRKGVLAPRQMATAVALTKGRSGGGRGDAGGARQRGTSFWLVGLFVRGLICYVCVVAVHRLAKSMFQIRA